jgi:hypothetical protein
MSAAQIEAEPAASAPAIMTSLSVIPVSPAQADRAALDPAAWTAADVRAYICEEIERIHGPQLPGHDATVVLGAFCERFGIPAAVRIARAAFEVYGGMWRGAPVTIRRFAEAHDSFFASQLLSAIAEG